MLNQNRLISVTPATGAITYYTYDYLGRRISKQTGTSAITRYIYDGWNLIAEYTGTTLQKSYTWGMDLSGSVQGAGGVGGLLTVELHTGANAGTYHPTYDGNGNISEYLDNTGATVAHYQYDPFGNTLVATGSQKDHFAHRFSTKPIDAETGLYYYGYRYYDATVGRWINRDPLGERGGLNLYAFVGNDGVNWVDALGLKRLKLRYRVLEKDDIRHAYHIKGTHVNSILAMLADISSRMREYHPEGIDPCDCIEKLEIVAHGGEEDDEGNDQRGVMNLGIDDVTQHTKDNADRHQKAQKIWKDAKKRGDDKRAKIQKRVVDSLREDYNKMRRLKKIAGLMCKDGKVEFLVCGAGGGDAGKKLKGDMENIFGAGNVTMYEGNVSLRCGLGNESDNKKKSGLK